MHTLPPPPASSVCLPNISLRERRKRLAASGVMAVIALAVLAVLLATGVDRAWRLLLFLPWAGAATSFFQWRDHT